jgi:transcription initiation factor TFIID subunit 2
VRLLFPFYTRLWRILTRCFRSFVFREAVDPMREGLPTYHKVIPKDQCRDLSLIKHKLDSDKYSTVDAFRDDIELMVDNAILFNGADSDVGIMATNLKTLVYHLVNENQNLPSWSAVGATKKRKGDKGSSSGGGHMKKVKLSG